MRIPPLLLATALLAPGPLLAQSQPGRSQASARPDLLELLAPTRAATGANGELLVTDYKLRRVCRVAPDGKRVMASFEIDGHPTALGALGNRVFVGNEDLQRVEIHTPNGTSLGTLGGNGFAVGDPRDLVIDAAQGRLYVIDGQALEILVFDLATPQGQLVATIGAPGGQIDNLQNPTGITLDSLSQEVLVADFGGLDAALPPRVTVFGYDGSYHATISGKGGPTGQYFARPQGLWVGSSGHLFVVDSWRGEVVVMDRAALTQVGVLGAYGKQPGELLLPLDLVVLGPDEDLFVTSCSGRRVERFVQGGKL